MIRSSVPRNSNSCATDHTGNWPPEVDTLHLPPGPGKDRTQTCTSPDSSEAYAMNLPSGENAGSTSTTVGSFRNGSTLPGLGRSGSLRSMGSVKISGNPVALAENTRRAIEDESFGPNEPGRPCTVLSTNIFA